MKNKLVMLFLVGFITYGIGLIIGTFFVGPLTKGKPVLIMPATYVVNDTVQLPECYEMKVTYYCPTVGQCDVNPFQTADGSIIDTTLLKEEKIRWVGLSRDMLKRWGGPYDYGDTLYVYHADNRTIRGRWVVHDCTKKGLTKTIDLLRHPDASILLFEPEEVLVSKQQFYIERE